MGRSIGRRGIWLSSALLTLASCGGEAPERDAGAITVVSATPVANSQPAPGPAPAPAPGPGPAVAPELYAIGRLTWSFEGDVPDDVRSQITDSMNWAVNMTNTLADYRGNVIVTYDARVPTAEAGFQYMIRFGGYLDRVTALHELAHWLGSGSIEAWPRHVVDGRFDGDVTNVRLRAYDGDDAILHADSAHFWPYGYDGGEPFREPQRNVMLVSAQRADMGLSDGAFYMTGDRSLMNRSSRLVLGAPGGGGTSPQASTFGSASSIWSLAYVDGYLVLRNRSTGLVVDSMGSTSDGSPVSLASASHGPAQQWETIPTDDGWFLLRNRRSGKCLDNLGQSAAGAEIRVWFCGGHPNQQWHLVR